MSEDFEIIINSDSLPKSFYNMARNEEKSVDEFIGLAKGLLVNGELTDNAIKTLKNWIKANPYLAENYPLDIFKKAIAKVKLKSITDEDRKTIFDLLTKIVGGEQLIENQSTKLPLDDPQPEIEIKDHSFCFTGVFTFAPRDVMKQKVKELGGIVLDRVTTKLDYLVIGDLASRDWVHSNYGRKIEDAVRFRKRLGNPSILAELTLVKHF